MKMMDKAEPMAGGGMPPAGMAGDMSQGYTLELSVLPDGTYKVGKPMPLMEEAASEMGAPGAEMGEDFDSIGAALKQVLAVIKENPVGGDGQKQFDAGFSGG